MSDGLIAKLRDFALPLVRRGVNTSDVEVSLSPDERLASALRYQRSRESDLIYEAYYDAFDTELGSTAST